LGVAIYSEDRETAIHVRDPDRVPSLDRKRVQKDQLFNEFWASAERETLDVRTERRHAELEGLIRVLKVNGKPAKGFYIFGQFPIEVIPLRILKISHEPDPPKGQDGPKKL
jgi:hypothetical protein